MQCEQSQTLLSPWKRRWNTYRDMARRCGITHALLACAGRFIPGIWRCLGPIWSQWRLRRQLPRLPRRLHLGCAGQILPDWINGDIVRHADFFIDARRPLQFPSGWLTLYWFSVTLSLAVLELAS